VFVAVKQVPNWKVEGLADGAGESWNLKVRKIRVRIGQTLVVQSASSRIQKVVVVDGEVENSVPEGLEGVYVLPQAEKQQTMTRVEY
jgi:hypothetical protein